MAAAFTENGLDWFALRVRTRAERTVSDFLRSRGFETICPTYVDRRKYSDRIKTVEAALFPGYTFCCFNPSDRLPVLSSPGVDYVVGFGQQPHPVDPSEIRALTAIVESGVLAQPHPFLKIGQKVRVQSGPLTNLEGILVSTKSEYRLVLSVTLLQRSIVAEIDSAHVRPI